MAVKFSVGVGDDKGDKRLSAARKKLPSKRRTRRAMRDSRPPAWPLSQPPEDEEGEPAREPAPEWAW